MPAVSPSKYLTMAGWNDIPHLTEDAKAKQLAETPKFLRKARSQGIPSLGAGAIYPNEEESIRCEPFAIPRHYRRCYGLDVGWNRTACIWGAIDPEEDILYLYTEHYQGEVQPVVHASAIKARGEWIPGAIDPASNGRSQIDGERLMVQYRDHGLNIHPAENSVEAGIYAVGERLDSGRLKVFSTCTNWFAEHRLYRRDEKGKIVKAYDHLMDATRYLVVSGLRRAIAKPAEYRGQATRGAADATAGY
jgi:hypothetical protein